VSGGGVFRAGVKIRSDSHEKVKAGPGVVPGGGVTRGVIPGAWYQGRQIIYTMDHIGVGAPIVQPPDVLMDELLEQSG